MSSWVVPASFTIFPQVGVLAVELIFKTSKQIKTWYNKLETPPWKPPNWLFGPVWTALYTGMGYASYLIYRDGIGSQRNLALGLYAAQLGINWIWSPIFFHYHKLGLATIGSATMWAAIGATAWSFYGINKTAAYLFLPYLAWVSFATPLSFSIWQRNKNRKID